MNMIMNRGIPITHILTFMDKWTPYEFCQILSSHCGDHEENYAEFNVLTAVVMKSSVLWDITPCSPLKANWSFGVTRHLHLQDRRISQASDQPELG
jgi:hypothetical protein